MFTVRCIATAIFYYNHVCMLMFDGKATAIFRYFVIIILYCKSIHPVIFFNKIHFYSTVKPVLRGHLWDKEKVAF